MGKNTSQKNIAETLKENAANFGIIHPNDLFKEFDKPGPVTRSTARSLAAYGFFKTKIGENSDGKNFGGNNLGNKIQNRGINTAMNNTSFDDLNTNPSHLPLLGRTFSLTNHHVKENKKIVENNYDVNHEKSPSKTTQRKLFYPNNNTSPKVVMQPTSPPVNIIKSNFDNTYGSRSSPLMGTQTQTFDMFSRMENLNLFSQNNHKDEKDIKDDKINQIKQKTINSKFTLQFDSTFLSKLFKLPQMSSNLIYKYLPHLSSKFCPGRSPNLSLLNTNTQTLNNSQNVNPQVLQNNPNSNHISSNSSKNSPSTVNDSELVLNNDGVVTSRGIFSHFMSILSTIQTLFQQNEQYLINKTREYYQNYPLQLNIPQIYQDDINEEIKNDFFQSIRPNFENFTNLTHSGHLNNQSLPTLPINGLTSKIDSPPTPTMTSFDEQSNKKSQNITLPLQIVPYSIHDVLDLYYAENSFIDFCDIPIISKQLKQTLRTITRICSNKNPPNSMTDNNTSQISTPTSPSLFLSRFETLLRPIQPTFNVLYAKQVIMYGKMRPEVSNLVNIEFLPYLAKIATVHRAMNSLNILCHFGGDGDEVKDVLGDCGDELCSLLGFEGINDDMHILDRVNNQINDKNDDNSIGLGNKLLLTPPKSKPKTSNRNGKNELKSTPKSTPKNTLNEFKHAPKSGHNYSNLSAPFPAREQHLNVDKNYNTPNLFNHPQNNPHPDPKRHKGQLQPHPLHSTISLSQNSSPFQPFLPNSPWFIPLIHHSHNQLPVSPFQFDISSICIHTMEISTGKIAYNNDNGSKSELRNDMLNVFLKQNDPNFEPENGRNCSNYNHLFQFKTAFHNVPFLLPSFIPLTPDPSKNAKVPVGYHDVLNAEKKINQHDHNDNNNNIGTHNETQFDSNLVKQIPYIPYTLTSQGLENTKQYAPTSPLLLEGDEIKDDGKIAQIENNTPPSPNITYLTKMFNLSLSSFLDNTSLPLPSPILLHQAHKRRNLAWTNVFEAKKASLLHQHRIDYPNHPSYLPIHTDMDDFEVEKDMKRDFLSLIFEPNVIRQNNPNPPTPSQNINHHLLRHPPMINKPYPSIPPKLLTYCSNLSHYNRHIPKSFKPLSLLFLTTPLSSIQFEFYWHRFSRLFFHPNTQYGIRVDTDVLHLAMYLFLRFFSQLDPAVIQNGITIERIIIVSLYTASLHAGHSYALPLHILCNYAFHKENRLVLRKKSLQFKQLLNLQISKKISQSQAISKISPIILKSILQRSLVQLVAVHIPQLNIATMFNTGNFQYDNVGQYRVSRNNVLGDENNQNNPHKSNDNSNHNNNHNNNTNNTTNLPKIF
jgi:hypothetical protein